MPPGLTPLRPGGVFFINTRSSGAPGFPVKCLIDRYAKIKRR